MFIEKLILSNYRNYLRETFDFVDGVNVISGNNAQGKTNAAEAIFYLCTGWSPRVSRDKQVINRNANSARIEAFARSSLGKVSVSVDFFDKESKKICVNGVPVQKTGELLGNINSVMFDPQQLKLVQESPEDRRRFMDLALSQTDRKYFYALQKYRKILQQRNVLLKDPDKELALSTLPVWDEQSSAVAAEIVFARNEFIGRIKPLCEKAHSDITGGEEKLEVFSESGFSGSVQEIKDALKAEYLKNMEKDIEAGFTTAGPHRDDIKIKINGYDARVYGSQGQQRTAALSLKIGELGVFKQKFGEYPVLILDDAMSELDSARKERLLSMLDGVQTIVTCTDAEIVPHADKVFIVRGGAVVG